jgi:hypothetical protein
MSPLASAPDALTRLRSAVEIGFVALGVLVAIGVAVLFLALTGASRTGYAPRPQSPRDVPLSQYVPGVAPPTATVIQIGAGRQAPPASVLAPRSNGR